MPSPSDETDDELFEAVRQNRPDGWERFVRRYARIVYAVPRRMGLSDADAEEVCQATWLILYRHAALIHNPRSVVAWILRTAARESSRLRRGERRRAEIEEAAPRGESGPPPEPDEVVASLERVHRVREAIGSLGDPCRRLLATLYLEERSRSHREAAEVLGMPVGSVGPTRQRCLEKLARKLEGSLAPDAAEVRE